MRFPVGPCEGASVPLRILLVDDDLRFRAMAIRLLIADGVDIVGEVENGAGVAAAVALTQPDVVLLDIGLPDIAGNEVARRLRQDGASVVVILISTRDAEDGRRMAAGVAAGYLPKEALSLRAILDVTEIASCALGGAGRTEPGGEGLGQSRIGGPTGPGDVPVGPDQHCRWTRDHSEHG